MAMTAATKTSDPNMNAVNTAKWFVEKGGKLEIGSFQLTDTQYEAGGFSIGLSFTPDIILFSQSPTYFLDYDYTNGLVKAYETGATTNAPLAEATANDDLTTACTAVKYIAFKAL